MLGFCFRVVPVTDSDPVLFARPRLFLRNTCIAIRLDVGDVQKL